MFIEVIDFLYSLEAGLRAALMPGTHVWNRRGSKGA